MWFFYQFPLTVKHIVLLTRSVLWQRLWVQVPAPAHCLIGGTVKQSYAVIIKSRKINSVQLIVLICINQSVSSLNKLCFLNFLASFSAGTLLCIFVDGAKPVQRPTEAAFLKPGGKTMFCGYKMYKWFAGYFMYSCTYYLSCSLLGVKSYCIFTFEGGVQVFI